MSPEQYWEKDNTLVIDYRKADKLRFDRENQMAWLQGLYFYDALCKVSPILHAFAGSDSKPGPYPELPYQLNKAKREEEKQDVEEKHFAEGFGIFAKNYNKVKAKRGELNGDGGDSRSVSD